MTDSTFIHTTLIDTNTFITYFDLTFQDKTKQTLSLTCRCHKAVCIKDEGVYGSINIQVLIVFGCSTAVWSSGVHLVCWSVVTSKSCAVSYLVLCIQ